MFNKKTVEDIDVDGKRVLVRVDFNVPIEDGQVADDTRIRAAMPTIDYLLEGGAALILCSHLGRPKGEVRPELSLRPVAEYLAGMVDVPLSFAEDSIGPAAESAAGALQPGQILLLENTRFHAGEKANDPDVARQLASLADVFVNDAFGTAHRSHASNVGVTEFLPTVAGFLLEKEIQYLGKALEDPERPFVAILGGAKVAGKIEAIRSLLQKADQILIGGGIANTFFKAQGHSIGDSLVDDDSLEIAQELLELGGDKLLLPVDVAVADAFDADAERKVLAVDSVPAGWQILDIGPKTIEQYAKVVSEAKTVAWNGPMGVFEFERFAKGTFGLAQAVAESPALSIIGGGESAAAIRKSGLTDQVSHVSTGGGASLQMLEGKQLPGLAAVNDR